VSVSVCMSAFVDPSVPLYKVIPAGVFGRVLARVLQWAGDARLVDVWRHGIVLREGSEEAVLEERALEIVLSVSIAAGPANAESLVRHIDEEVQGEFRELYRRLERSPKWRWQLRAPLTDCCTSGWREAPNGGGSCVPL
jgi:hypothetical protein